jgi:hypothetical protein
MANHYYGIVGPAYAERQQRSDIVVGTSSDASAVIELRITDGTVTQKQAFQFCEYLSKLIATRDPQVIASGTLL